MRRRRLLLIGLNIALLAAFWPFINSGAPPSGYPAGSASMTAPSRFLPDPIPRTEPPSFARPLFRERLVPAEPVETPAPPGLSVRLVGAALTEGHRIALVEREGTVLRVEEGDELEGWQVTAIAPRAIRFTRAKQHIDVQLDSQTDQP